MKSKNWSEGRCNGADGGDVVVGWAGLGVSVIAKHLCTRAEHPFVSGRAGLGVSVIAKTDDVPTSCAKTY